VAKVLLPSNSQGQALKICYWAREQECPNSVSCCAHLHILCGGVYMRCILSILATISSCLVSCLTQRPPTPFYSTLSSFFFPPSSSLTPFSSTDSSSFPSFSYPPLSPPVLSLSSTHPVAFFVFCRHRVKRERSKEGDRKREIEREAAVAESISRSSV
jgi:hypothetical protein